MEGKGGQRGVNSLSHNDEIRVSDGVPYKMYTNVKIFEVWLPFFYGCVCAFLPRSPFHVFPLVPFHCIRYIVPAFWRYLLRQKIGEISVFQFTIYRVLDEKKVLRSSVGLEFDTTRRKMVYNTQRTRWCYIRHQGKILRAMPQKARCCHLHHFQW